MLGVGPPKYIKDLGPIAVLPCLSLSDDGGGE